MIAVSREMAENYSGAVLIGRDMNSNMEIYWVEESSIPAMSHPDPISLLPLESLNKLRRSYGINKQAFQTLTKAYKNKQKKIELDTNQFDVKLGIEVLEREILNSLKKELLLPRASLMPYFNLDNARHSQQHLMVYGSSGGGKSTWVCKQFCMLPEVRNKKIYYFSPHNKTDRSVLWLKDNKGDKDFYRMDLDKIKQDEIFFGVHSFEPNSVIICDDLEGLPRRNAAFSLRKSLFQMASEISVQGRHAGLTLCFISHDPYLSRESKTLRSEVGKYVIMWSHGARSVYTKLLRQELNFTVSFINRLYDKARGSRWLLVNKTFPTHCMSAKSVVLF